MDETISLPVTTVAHIPRYVRPELGKILAEELKHASKDGLWGSSYFQGLVLPQFQLLLRVHGLGQHPTLFSA